MIKIGPLLDLELRFFVCVRISVLVEYLINEGYIIEQAENIAGEVSD